jgi:hypothetical protein
MIQPTKVRRLSPLLTAMIGTAVVALAIGCGGTAFVVPQDSNFQVGPDVRILPQDGSAIVTAIGKDGVQIASRPLDNIDEGHLLVICAPVLDEARMAIGHQGGYKQLHNKMKLVPVEFLPPRFRSRQGNYSHYLLFNGRVTRKIQFDLSGRMDDGSIRYASSTGSGSRGFISGITHSVSHVANDVGNDVTNVATDVGSGVTDAATDVGNAVTDASVAVATTVTNTADEVTSDLSSAETSIVSAVGGSGTWVLSQIEAVGEDFSKIYKDAEIPMENIVSEGIQDFEDVANVLAGNFTVSLDVNGGTTVNFNNMSLQAKNGATLNLNGSLKVGGGLTASMSISNYEMKKFSASLGLSGSADVTVSGSGSWSSEEYVKITMDPIVVPAGDVPVVVVPILTVAANGTLSSSAGLEFKASLGGTLGMVSTNGSSLTPTDSGTASGSVKWTGSNNNLVTFTFVPVQPTLTFNIDDVAGPFFQMDTPALNLQVGTTAATLTGTVDFSVGFNLDPLGYEGWQASKQLTSKQIFTTSIAF